MKLILKLLLLVILIVVLFIPGTAMAKGLQDDKVITGGSYTLQSGEILDGNLIIFGGVVTTLMNSTVEGDTVLMGGTLTINGNIAKNVVAIGGIVTLGDNAIIHGDLIVVAGTLNRENGAVVEGQVVNGFQIPRNWIDFRGIDVPDVPQTGSLFTPLWKGLWFFFRTFLWAAVAALIAIFFPNPTDRVARAIASQTILSGRRWLADCYCCPAGVIDPGGYHYSYPSQLARLSGSRCCLVLWPCVFRNGSWTPDRGCFS